MKIDRSVVYSEMGKGYLVIALHRELKAFFMAMALLGLGLGLGHT